MEVLDWVVLLATLSFIVIFGAIKTRKQDKVQDFLKGGNQGKWWTVGLSVMATQASEITFLSTPGQAFSYVMGFVQFYFSLTIDMVIICLYFIIFYHSITVTYVFYILMS